MVCCEYTPYMCKTIKYNLVISEPLTSFMLRNLETDDIIKYNSKFIITSHSNITVEQYTKLKPHNPDNDGCYLWLIDKDYSKLYDGEG